MIFTWLCDIHRTHERRHLVGWCSYKLKFHLDQFPRNFLVTSWRLPRNICYGEVTRKLVPVEFEL